MLSGAISTLRHVPPANVTFHGYHSQYYYQHYHILRCVTRSNKLRYTLVNAISFITYIYYYCVAIVAPNGDTASAVTSNQIKQQLQ